MGKLNRAAYRKLVQENLEWLLSNAPRSLERDHIAQILEREIRENTDD